MLCYIGACWWWILVMGEGKAGSRGLRWEWATVRGHMRVTTWGGLLVVG